MKKRFVYDKYKKMKSPIFDRFEEFSFMYVVMVKSKEKAEKEVEEIKKKGEGMVQNLGDKRIGFPKVRNDSSFMETQR